MMRLNTLKHLIVVMVAGFALTGFHSYLYAQPDRIQVMANRLKTQMDMPSSNRRAETWQRQYFDRFPGTFDDFDAIFGWNWTGGLDGSGRGGPLYSDSIEYIDAFFSLSAIPRREFDEKLISLCIGGHWDADAVNYLKHYMTDLFTSRARAVLRDREDQEVKAFFIFYFDSAQRVFHEDAKPPEIPPNFLEWETAEPRLYRLILEVIQELYGKSSKNPNTLNLRRYAIAE